MPQDCLRRRAWAEARRARCARTSAAIASAGSTSGHATPPERILLAALEALRIAVNRELTLGLWRYEGHYALYPPGARYARHVDRFRDDDARVLSVVLYLNRDWHADEGGALRIGRRAGPARDVLPAGGTLVAFLAAEFEHEVLPATRSRLAVSGWFRTREATIQ